MITRSLFASHATNNFDETKMLVNFEMLVSCARVEIFEVGGRL